MTLPRRTDAFESFKRNIERNFEQALTRPWPSVLGWTFLSMPFGAWSDTRTPLCDLIDKGGKYELEVENVVLCTVVRVLN